MQLNFHCLAISTVLSKNKQKIIKWVNDLETDASVVSMYDALKIAVKLSSNTTR
jgi:hypothetical protein